MYRKTWLGGMACQCSAVPQHSNLVKLTQILPMIVLHSVNLFLPVSLLKHNSPLLLLTTAAVLLTEYINLME